MPGIRLTEGAGFTVFLYLYEFWDLTKSRSSSHSQEIYISRLIYEFCEIHYFDIFNARQS
jgi:hypothetical protein